MQAAARPTLDALRAMLARPTIARAAPPCPTGLPPLDRVLPQGGLRRGALHEIVSTAADRPAAEGFAATLLAALAGPVLWCRAVLDLYGPGLAALGLAPDRLILVRAPRPRDLLWAMEEGLRTPGLAAVIGQPASLDLTASRRLQLAAEGSGTIGIVLTCAETASPTASVTRWRVEAAPSGQGFGADRRDFGLARARWRVTLTRCRGAVPGRGEDGFGSWLVEEGGGAPALARDVPSVPDEMARALPRTARPSV